MSLRRAARAALLASAVLLLAACAGARGARAPDPARDPIRRAFEVPGHGALEIAIPPGWTVEASAGDPPGTPTIRLRRPGASFLALLAPLGSPGDPEGEPERADTAQLFAELARRKALEGAVEREIPLEVLVGAGVHGFWFAATDRELLGKETGPDEWRHLLQGAAAVGPLVVAFTLLDDGPGPQRSELLELVRGARHAGDGAEEEEEEDAAPGGMELDVDAPAVPLRVALPGKAWAVLVDLPGFRVFKAREGEAGSAIVLGQSPETLVVASVILRPAGQARDALACREADLARIRAGVPGVGEVRLATVGDAPRAAYALTGRGVQEHAHAWLHRDGACANVHVSKVEPAPGDRERMERILDSVRFGEDL